VSAVHPRSENSCYAYGYKAAALHMPRSKRRLLKMEGSGDNMSPPSRSGTRIQPPNESVACRNGCPDILLRTFSR